MAYTAATKIPSLQFFQWGRPDAANPRLASPIDDSTTTLTFTSAPQDRLGAVITGNFLMNVKNSDSYVELIYVPAGGMSVDGLTATGCVRGIRISGLDYTTGDSDFAASHPVDAPVGCAISAVYDSIVQAWLAGTLASGGSGLIIGTDADGTVTISRSTGVGTSTGWLRWNTTGDVAQFSNDGAAWVSFSDSIASVIVKVSAADTTAGYLATKVVAGDGLDESITSPAGDERLQLDVDVTDFIDTNYGLTEDTNNIRVNLGTDPGLEFVAGALEVKVKADGGITKDANGLSLTNAVYPKSSGLASEAITEGQAVASLPVEYKWDTGLTDVAENLGAVETIEGFSMKFIPTKTVTGITSVNFRAAEAVNGATALGNLVITVQTDSAGSPSGTLVDADATTTISQVTQRTWNTTLASRSANFGGSFDLVKGTTYWLCFRVSAFNGTNYLKLGDLSSYDENYVATTRKTYDASAGTWGSSTTTDPIAFWFNVELGNGLVPTDASFGRRTWGAVGVADANYSIADSVSYYYDLVPISDLGVSLTDFESDYYISTTAGQFSTTIPNWSYGNDFKYKAGNLTLDSSGNTLLQLKFGTKESIVSYSQNTAATFSYPLWFKPAYLEAFSNTGGAGQYWGDNSSFYDGSTTFTNGSQVGGTFLDNNDGNGGNATATAAIIDKGFTVTQTGAHQLTARIYAKAA